MVGVVSSQASRRLFVGEDSIHTTTANPSQSRNLLFAMTGVEQLRDVLVANDAVGMIVLTSL